VTPGPLGQYRAAGPPFEGWSSFSARLLDALEQAPSVIVPQIVPFLTRGNGRRWVFDGAVARSLFDMDRLGELLRRHPIPESGLPGRSRERYRAVMRAIGQIGNRA